MKEHYEVYQEEKDTLKEIEWYAEKGIMLNNDLLCGRYYAY